MLVSKMPNQDTFIKMLSKSYRQFKLIEIVDEKRVIEHFQYEFPFY
jgi:hypothetical protein